MQYLLTLAVTATVFVADISAQRGDRGRRRNREPLVLEHFDYTEVEFETENIDDGNGRYGLYLPKGWSGENAAQKDGKLPVAIWLHGFGGFREFESRGAATTLDSLRGADAIPEIALATFVAPGTRRSSSVYMNGETAGQVEDAIAIDMIAHLVKNYPIDPARERHGIMGISLGGFGALKIAMKHTDVFSSVGVHSAAIFSDDPSQLSERILRRVGRSNLDSVFGDPIDAAKWAAEMPMGLARNAKKGEFANLAIYFDAGGRDRYGFGPPNVELSKVMKAAGVEHTFTFKESGGHAWSSSGMLDNVKESMKFVSKSISKPIDTPKATTDAAASKPSKDGAAASKPRVRKLK